MFNHEKIFKDIPIDIRNNTAIVGGYVRDKIMGLEPSDIDFVVKDVSVDTMLNLKFKMISKNNPIFIDRYKREYVLCNLDRVGLNIDNNIKRDFLYDLSRRDLTINSILLDSNGNIYDPFNGIDDINNKILRHVNERFKDDPIRVLRVARFITKYPDFKIHEDTVKICQSLKYELKDIFKERIIKELNKVLVLDNPSKFFYILKDMDLLLDIFPEFEFYINNNIFESKMNQLDISSKYIKNTIFLFSVLYSDILYNKINFKIKNIMLNDISIFLNSVFILKKFLDDFNLKNINEENKQTFLNFVRNRNFPNKENFLGIFILFLKIVYNQDMDKSFLRDLIKAKTDKIIVTDEELLKDEKKKQSFIFEEKNKKILQILTNKKLS